jgi:hypothetical protein
VDKTVKDPSFPLNVSCQDLLKALEPFLHTQSQFIILSFDEIHVLGESYIHFRRALRALLTQPVFSIFLSTAGHLYKFIPNPTMDPSARMVNQGWAIPSFSELGFDHFANGIGLASGQNAMNVDITFSQVSSTAQLVKFGRPLYVHMLYCQLLTSDDFGTRWATRYDRGNTTIQANIILFAASKLLGGGINPWGPDAKLKLELPQRLGCLAQRLPIEFLSVSYSSNLADPQTVQVWSHMRVVIRVDGNLETLVTLCPSEPILSEAAYWLMSSELFKPADALKGILGGFSVDSGDHGELLAMLLFILARDRAVGPADSFGSPKNGARSCSVNTFLSSLFVESAWKTAIKDRESAVKELSGDSKLYFSHFIKIHQFKLLDVKYIMRQMARGAAILCATCQNGVDLLIPFIRGGDVLSEKNLGVILVQVKNDMAYSATPKPMEISRMSIEGLSGIPTLRFFFALAAKRSTITAVDTKPQPQNTFDFWVAGLSSDILLPVKNEGDKVWSGLLDASYGWKRTYREHGWHGEKGQRDRMTNLRRSMNPGCASHDAHWNSWWEVLSGVDMDMEETDLENSGGSDSEDMGGGPEGTEEEGSGEETY